MPRVIVFTLTAALLAGCGGSSPSAPSTPAPTPITPASLQLSGQGSFTTCLTFTNDCDFSASIQNVGTGCASGTSAIARFFDANSAQVGSDVQMGAVGTSLAARTIRPGEVVALLSITRVSATVANSTKTYRIIPAWNDVRCP